MIRKAIILGAVVAAIGTGVAYVVSYTKTMHLASDLTSHRHVCIEAVQGCVYLHYAYSDVRSFLRRVDKHEHGNQAKPRTGFVTYGEQEYGSAPDVLGPPDPNPSSSIPMVTYAWSNRVGLPMWLPLILFALYPSIILARKRSYRGPLGLDLRIESTAVRMVVTTVVGTILMPMGYLAGGALGFYWMHDVHGAPMWVAIPIVIGVSFAPGIYFTLWLFWRLTPGDHGGLLWRRRRRLARERGLCVNCAYDLTGNVSGVCPECGKAI